MHMFVCCDVSVSGTKRREGESEGVVGKPMCESVWCIQYVLDVCVLQENLPQLLTELSRGCIMPRQLTSTPYCCATAA